MSPKKERRKNNRGRDRLFAMATVALFISGIFILWIASLRIPALNDLYERRVDQSTKIYDRTGEVLLYDMSPDVRRKRIPFESISPYIKEATLAIEDKDFYEHSGVKLSSFLRAVFVNLSTLSFSQGGSTITQQVVKNSILTKDKTPTRKLKELILALKLDNSLSKDDILTLYLNEIPYGGNLYGIEEAAQAFFGKSALDLTIAESAYLAALPKAPTFYSPYGPNKERLEERKNLVLREMLGNQFISQEEFDEAMSEEVEFNARQNTGGIRAPHFVFFVINHLTNKYGENILQSSGFKVVTTLDYDLQRQAEALSAKYGEINEERFKGENNGMVAIDPKTGDILMMVGSRNYFDDQIDGNFNVTTAHRQPGSTFKPFVYATMLNKGYTDRTILFDIPIQFSTRCDPGNFTTDDICYAPGNYDDRYRGPMTMRNALAQSVNIPAVQGIYLAGVNNSINLAQSMGIESLKDKSRFGLSLVLGGGDVSLLDMVSAYSVFANDGVRNPYNPILRVEDGDGNTIESRTSFQTRVLPEQTARMISDILSDNAARTPGFGANSALYIPSRPVAVKTGTSNDYRDAWIIGYTPNLAVGAWVGNNDNSPMERKVSGLVVAPLWREYMNTILPSFPVERFIDPAPVDYSKLKPVLAGDWYTGDIHSILHWVDKDNPRGPLPSNPARDSQYNHWEYAVQRYIATSGLAAPAPEPQVQETPYNPYIYYPYTSIMPPVPVQPL